MVSSRRYYVSIQLRTFLTLDTTSRPVGNACHIVQLRLFTSCILVSVNMFVLLMIFTMTGVKVGDLIILTTIRI